MIMMKETVKEDDNPLPLSSLLTPFVYEDNVTGIGPYSSSENCPWGKGHLGLDIFPVNNSPFQAVADCEFHMDKFYNTINGMWQINMRLTYNSSVWFGYAFEMWSSNESDADRQLELIPHTEGTLLSKGDLLGNLLTVGESAHVDWAMRIHDVSVCPAPYFTPEAYQSVMSVIHKVNPTWEMCYCDCDYYYFFFTETRTTTEIETHTITETLIHTEILRTPWPLIFLPTLALISILRKRKGRRKKINLRRD
ncbi:MAG: hypothetical protein ACFFC7_27955 [Candidatus Hermodarchaeota archaeon]